MSAKKQHSPGPWHWGGIVPADGPGKQYMNIRNDNGWIATLEPSENALANAAFICRACNAHDDLLAACKAAKLYLCGPGDPTERELREMEADAMRKLTAAIQKAEAENAE